MRLLIIGQLNGYITAAAKIALEKGAQVKHVQTTDDALVHLRSGHSADLVMIDVALNIKSFIDAAEAERLHVNVVACGVAADAQAAVKAIRAGAQEYIPLPPDAELIAAVIEAASVDTITPLYQDAQTAKLVDMAERIAPTEASVLITGESGTGKEVMARFIHSKSKRAAEKMVSINCAAIPENLLESELFGHEKGAFTGAVSRRIGKFEEANNGTLLLDEISEMQMHLQAKLLRVIQEREIDRLGGSKPVKVNIRLMATSNRDLREEVKKGTFREDLYFRLNVVNLHLEPLRKRPKDVEVLANHFLVKYREESAHSVEGFEPEALKALQSYPWPGNVRELENAVHRAMLLANGAFITVDNLNLFYAEAEAMNGTTGTSLSSESGAPKSMAEVERHHILNTLETCFGNRTHAANILGISIRTLRNKLKQYGQEGFNVPPSKEELASA